MEIVIGLLVCFLVMTIIKLIHYRYFKSNIGNPEGFDLWFWIKDNWMDYFINLGISFLVFLYDTDAINFLNYILQKVGTDWAIPGVEDKGFYFVIVPIGLTFIAYKFLRNKASLPIQEKLKSSH